MILRNRYVTDTIFAKAITFALSMTVTVIALFTAFVITPALAASTKSSLQKQEQARHDQRWDVIKTSLFPDKEINDGNQILTLEAPVVPKDPAMVPITIKALIPQTPDRYIQKISLLIDHNPAPLAAVFHLTPRSGEAHLRTRVRVNEFSAVRAVAELNTGELYVATDFVKASGGCDTPPRVDTDALTQSMGRMNLRLPGGARLGEISTADLLITHPNFNGMQVGNNAGEYLPMRMVQRIEVSYAGDPIVIIDGHLSLSQDPKFRFYYVPEKAGEFTARVVDSDNTEFQDSWAVNIKQPEGETTLKADQN